MSPKGGSETSPLLPGGGPLSPSSSSSSSSEEPNYFPHLPPYKNPTSGFLSLLPSSWIPYAQLMRLDRPAGLYAFYFPYLIGLAYAACITPSDSIPSVKTLFILSAILLPFNILFRGATCTWNDTLDKKFDQQVARCRHRPVARGAVSVPKAHLWTLTQTLACAPIIWFGFPGETIPHAVIGLGLFLVYAYMKRVTYYPQAVLGVAFAWAIFFSVAAIPGAQEKVYEPGTVALAGSVVLWAFIYDTIYAHQDIADDVQAGVKSSALALQNWTKVICSGLTIIQGGMLVLTGLWSGFGWGYYLGTVGGVLGTTGWYVWRVDLKDPESCGKAFRTQFWTVGGGYVVGFVVEYGRKVGWW
ncbi:UbiA prenyltransferase family-domain-containing protein [Podospora fimiseda]|uniref:Diterpenoid pyrone biosynthesis cluster protein C n=1 Tax=Podospora fimiseda TaxID=252190 RepID=A0AAN7BTF6_9PEZI|nr:UbiA prenyltransferase family-domain-containing protein [Podospora fimiseda]